MSRNKPERRKSIVVPLNPGEKIELRFYGEDKADIRRSWFGTTEELANVIDTGRRELTEEEIDERLGELDHEMNEEAMRRDYAHKFSKTGGR